MDQAAGAEALTLFKDPENKPEEDEEEDEKDELTWVVRKNFTTIYVLIFVVVTTMRQATPKNYGRKKTQPFILK